MGCLKLSILEKQGASCEPKKYTDKKELTLKNSSQKAYRQYFYGFNGQEKDDEIYGTGNSYTAEFWQYDPRLGRRWNIDPMSFKYPWQSPYVAFNNNPIFYNDPLGLEGEDPQEGDDDKIYDQGTTEEISVYGKRKTSEEILPPIALEKPSLFRRIMNKIKNFIIKVDDFLSRRKRNYSPYKDKNKNSYESKGGIHGVSEDGQGAENHRVLFDPTLDRSNEPETINLDVLIPAKNEVRELIFNQNQPNNKPKVENSTGVAEKARENASDKMGGGSKATGTGNEKVIIQDPGGSYMYNNGKWYRRIAPPSDSMYVPIEKLGQEVPDYIINQLEN